MQSIHTGPVSCLRDLERICISWDHSHQISKNNPEENQVCEPALRSRSGTPVAPSRARSHRYSASTGLCAGTAHIKGQCACCCLCFLKHVRREGQEWETSPSHPRMCAPRTHSASVCSPSCSAQQRDALLLLCTTWPFHDAHTSRLLAVHISRASSHSGPVSGPWAQATLLPQPLQSRARSRCGLWIGRFAISDLSIFSNGDDNDDTRWHLF